MVVGGVGLSIAMLQLDAGLGAEDRGRTWWINRGDGEDARNLLSTLLGATITMASMVLSITVVALSLAANSYGSRLIRVFRADLGTQLVLGAFIAAIVYCLIVLRSVEGEAALSEVPHVSVTVGTALALCAVLALLGFIQGVAKLMTADEVVLRVERELNATVLALPESREEPSSEPELASSFEAEAARLPLPREGYVQRVDYPRLMAWAERNDSQISLKFRAGDFVVQGDRLVLVYPPPSDSEQARRAIEHFIKSGKERTPTQDLEFAVRHLVEVAVRALSPGINDPFTAKVVIDRLRGSLSRLAERSLPSSVVQGHDGQVRIHRPTTDYGHVLDAAFHQIRQSGSDKPAVLIHMLEAINRIADHTKSEAQRQALARHATLIRDTGRRDVSEPADKAALDVSFAETMKALDAARSKTPSQP
jgi:uncharacterized membrane protein